MFPIVSAVTIVPVLFIAFVALDSYALLLVGGFFLGIGGTAFAVGVPFVNAWFPPERRGLAIGIFGAGMGGTAISALTTVKLSPTPRREGAVPDHRRRAGRVRASPRGWSCATPRAASVPTTVADRPGSRPTRGCRSPGRPASLYAVAFGGYVAFSVYLPAYLKTAYGLTPADAANRMAGFVVVAVIMRPVGGWLSDRFGPIPVLAAGFGVVVVGAAISAGTPPLDGVGTVAFLAMAAALGCRQRRHLRADRQGDRPVPGRRRDRPGRRRRRPRRVRAAADHGLRLRPHRLLRHRAVAALRSPPHSPSLLTVDRRPPYRHAGQEAVDSIDEEVHARDRDGRRADRRAGAHPAVLHQGHGLRRPADPDQVGGREADDFYRDRWSHDKVVRSTHGVNCTGSCSWKVYVKDGIITWETQQTDYPSVGPDSPEYEPRGCPRGAAFSWYTYSPTRVRYPYVRGVLLQMFREAKAQHDGDPVRRGSTSSRTRSAPRPTSPPAARAAWSARPGTRRPRSSPPRTSTRSRSTAPTGSPASRRSRRCRWSRTPPAPGS